MKEYVRSDIIGTACQCILHYSICSIPSSVTHSRNVRCTQTTFRFNPDNYCIQKTIPSRKLIHPQAPAKPWQAVRKANCQGRLGTGALPAAVACKATYPSQCSACRHEVVSLLDATQQALEQRAATADVTSQPQPYDVLFDFYCMRSNFKAAATAQYALACRLSDARGRVPQWLHLRATALCKPTIPTLHAATAHV